MGPIRFLAMPLTLHRIPQVIQSTRKVSSFLRLGSVAQSAEKNAVLTFPAVCIPGILTTFDTSMFAPVVKECTWGLWQPVVTVTLLREAQIDTHLIYQEMARAKKNAPSNRTFSVVNV